MVVWFVPFIFFSMQVVKMFWRLLGEIQAGTIEQVHLSPLPPWLVAAAGRVVAAFAETLFVAAATYGIVTAFITVHIHWTPAALIPAVLIMAAAVGTSLIIAGVIKVPAWWADASHAFPLTDGVGSLNRVLLADGSVTSPWGIGGLVPLLITTSAYLAAGVLAFMLGERAAERRGTLGRY